MAVETQTHAVLAADTNQALGIATYAIEFIEHGEPDAEVIQRTELFHTDATLCGLSAIALGTNAPSVLRAEAIGYRVRTDDEKAPLGRSSQRGATMFGSSALLHAEKAVLANASAVREWDSNGTNFGYNPKLGNTAGEFGHNDFYPVAIAGCQMAGLDGATAIRAMVCIDEIRGRLAEVFSLKTYKIDHVVHGAIASAAVYGALLGATAEQIESAIGMVVAHYIPFRAIRAGKQLSDSKGSSAAISTEVALLSVQRSMMGFMGPRDIFRNPEAIFRIFEGPGQMFVAAGKDPVETEATDASPFELHLAMRGNDFAVMGMHFKIGLYEHQSAGAIQAVISLLDKAPHLIDDPMGSDIGTIKIVAYEPAYGIIGDPAKKNPTTRQSADHSMAYIIATLLRKALGCRQMGHAVNWKELMLGPMDFSKTAIFNEQTRKLMAQVEFVHGGEEYDKRYPDGIPTSVVITDKDGVDFDSGLIMYPAGHARNNTADLEDLLHHKFRMLAGFVGDAEPIIARFSRINDKSADEIRAINDLELKVKGSFE